MLCDCLLLELKVMLAFFSTRVLTSLTDYPKLLTGIAPSPATAMVSVTVNQINVLNKDRLQVLDPLPM